VSSARAFGNHSGAESREIIAPSIVSFDMRRLWSGLESGEVTSGLGESDRCGDLPPWPVCRRFVGRVGDWLGDSWAVHWVVGLDIVCDVDSIQPPELSVSRIETALLFKVNDSCFLWESGIMLLSDSKDDDSERVRLRRPDG
jgi:hypothetical protein